MGDALYPETLDATTIACRQFSIGGARIPAHKGNHFFVDYDLGNNGYSGKSWDKAWLSVTYALTQVSDWDTIWVAGRGSEEAITVARGLDHLSLIGASGTQRAWHLENNTGVATDVVLTVKAKFFYLANVLIEPQSSGTGVKLVRAAAVADGEADYATLENVHVWTGKYGVDLNGAPHGFQMLGGSIKNLRASGAVGLYVSSQAQDYPRRAWVYKTKFKGNVNHVVGGFADSLFEEVKLSAKGVGDNDTTTMLDLRNGSSNDVFGCQLGGTYSEVGGYYASGSEDNWIGNFGSAGVTTGNPA